MEPVPAFSTGSKILRRSLREERLESFCWGFHRSYQWRWLPGTVDGLPLCLCLFPRTVAICWSAGIPCLSAELLPERSRLSVADTATFLTSYSLTVLVVPKVEECVSHIGDGFEPGISSVLTEPNFKLCDTANAWTQPPF